MIMGLKMNKFYDPFLSILPEIDIHGLNRDMVKSVLNDFIKDNIKLDNKKIIVIHGKGKGILFNEVHSLLKKDTRVKGFYLDGCNTGCTIIELK